MEDDKRPERTLPLEDDDPKLGYDIRFLGLTTRGLSACRKLQVRTVQDFLRRDRREYTSLRNCGDRTYDDIAHKIRDFLAAPSRSLPSTPSPAADLHKPIREIVRNPRALRGFASLNLVTVGDFLDTPKETLLGLRGFGERTYWLVSQQVQNFVDQQSRDTAFLPDVLLDLEVRRLGIEHRLADCLVARGLTKIRSLIGRTEMELSADPEIGARGVASVRNALEQSIRAGIDTVLADPQQTTDARPRLVRVGARNTAERLFRIFSKSTGPIQLEDVLFRYRDWYRHGNMARLLDTLRKDPRFLEVERGTWSLRSRHEAELEAARPEAETIVEILSAQLVRQNIFRLHADSGVPTRQTYMVIECLRQDPRVRYLGRGAFCRHDESSVVFDNIREDFRRAMGEIVMSRFLENQPPRRRRLVECLLRCNRALIEPAPDRIDVLTNYPLNDERLKRLFALITAELKSGRGYATTGALLEIINTTELGGQWWTEHMLLDLLRRHEKFEILPGGIIARPNLGLIGWIQRRARECLRQAAAALAPEEILGEAPDLAAFAGCVQELMEKDPMVQCLDGVRYAVV